MSKPTTDPVIWSSDANYPAGTKSYSGTPTKVAPSAGHIAGGWKPGQKPPAPFLNFLLNNHGQWLEYLKSFTESALDNWYGPAVSPSVDATPAYGFCAGRDSSGFPLLVKGLSTKAARYSKTEGLTWAACTLPAGWGASSNMEALIWDGTYFVAVGAIGGNWIATSPDGITFTDRSPAGTNGLKCIAWDGASKYVAAGVNGKIFYATTPTGTWTAATAAGGYTGTFNEIIWDSVNSLFVLVGNTGAIQTSPDGINWTARTPYGSYAGNYRGIATNGSGRYVAVSTGPAMHYSDDGGATWFDATSNVPSTVTIPSILFYSQTFNQWLLVGNPGVLAATLDPVAGTWRSFQSPTTGSAASGTPLNYGGQITELDGRVYVGMYAPNTGDPSMLASMRIRT